MAAWFVLNCLQAAFLGVEGDESYYWVLSQQLDWGYFDHPPMVALLIKMGESIAHGPLFTRLGTVFISTLTIPIIFAALPEKLQHAKLFILLFLSIVILHVYGFVATPDAPLLFFSALFFYGYKSFLKKENVYSILMLTVSITGMFYSKYHGILPVFFVVVSNPKLLTRINFWIVILLATLLFLPHLYWQYLNDWPTFRYHLNERLGKPYEVSFTALYFMGQLLIWGPFVSFFFFTSIWKISVRDPLIRAYLFTYVGILLFFLLSSFKYKIEPHWTLVAATAYIALFIQILKEIPLKSRSRFFNIAILNIVLILIARVLLFLPISFFQKSSNYAPIFLGKNWANKVYLRAGDKPVLFTNSYILPSLYKYYHPNANSIGYNTKAYRKTHYSLSTEDCKYNGQDILEYKFMADSIRNKDIIYFPLKSGKLVPYREYTCINNLKLTAINLPSIVKANSTFPIKIIIENKGKSTIKITEESLRIDYAFFSTKINYINSEDRFVLPDKIIPPDYKTTVTILVKAPRKIGEYRFLLSIVNGHLEGNFASPFYKIEILK